MRHIGWKIAFGLSWIPALFLYGNLVDCFFHMGNNGGTESAAGGIGFLVLLIPSILFVGIQIGLGYLSFRK